MATTFQIPETSRKNPKKKVLLILLFVIIGLLCLCSFIGYFYGKSPSYKATTTAKTAMSVLFAPTLTLEPTSVPEVTAIPEPTITPKPTFTPEPTITAEPTITPKLTNTPRPTNTSKPTLSPTFSDIAEKLNYVNSIQPLLVNVTEELNALGQMSNLMSEDVSLLVNSSFTDIYFAVLDSIYYDMQEIVSVKPPTSLQTMHGYLKDALLEFGSVRSNLKSGITNFDLEDINSGTKHLNTFSEYINLAADAMK